MDDKLQDLVGKDFWDRPEGKTGLLIGAALLAGAGLGFWYYVLPKLIYLIQSTAFLAGVTAALGVALAALSSGRCRMLLSYGYKSLMRAITGLFVEIDPIGMLKGYLGDVRADLEKFKKEIAPLNSQCEQLESEISANDAEFRHLMSRGSAAQKKGRLAEAQSFALKAETLNQSNERIKAAYEKIFQLRESMNKLYDASRLKVENIEFQVQVKVRERKSMQAAHSAFKRAVRILNGDDTARELYDLTMENVSAEYSNQLGEIKNFLRESSGMLRRIDFENEYANDQAMQRLQEWEKELASEATTLLPEPDPAIEELPGQPEEDTGVAAEEAAPPARRESRNRRIRSAEHGVGRDAQNL